MLYYLVVLIEALSFKETLVTETLVALTLYWKLCLVSLKVFLCFYLFSAYKIHFNIVVQSVVIDKACNAKVN